MEKKKLFPLQQQIDSNFKSLSVCMSGETEQSDKRVKNVLLNKVKNPHEQTKLLRQYTQCILWNSKRTTWELLSKNIKVSQRKKNSLLHFEVSAFTFHKVLPSSPMPGKVSKIIISSHDRASSPSSADETKMASISFWREEKLLKLLHKSPKQFHRGPLSGTARSRQVKALTLSPPHYNINCVCLCGRDTGVSVPFHRGWTCHSAHLSTCQSHVSPRH